MLFLLKDFDRKKWMPLLAGKHVHAHVIGMDKEVHQVAPILMPITVMESHLEKVVINSSTMI